MGVPTHTSFKFENHTRVLLTYEHGELMRILQMFMRAHAYAYALSGLPKETR